LWPSRLNLWPTERLVRPYFEEGRQERGAYVFFVTRKEGGQAGAPKDLRAQPA
jgi:hypothetical protein